MSDSGFIASQGKTVIGAPFHCQLLWDRFEQRKKRNPRLSLRAFAARSGVAPGPLSEILKGKRPLTVRMASKIAERLALSPIDKMRFIESALTAKTLSSGVVLKGGAPGQKILLEEEAFKAISDWYHYAILNLIEIHASRISPDFIARRLHISRLEARRALLRLEKLKLIERLGGGYRRTKNRLHFESPSHNSALKSHHEQFLQKAQESLYRDPVSQRDFLTFTVAINPDNLDRAKKLVDRFSEELLETLSAGKRTIVYSFAFQLFPLEKPPSEG